MNYKFREDCQKINALMKEATGVSYDEDKRNNNRGPESMVFARDDKQDSRTKEEREKAKAEAAAVEEEILRSDYKRPILPKLTKFEWNTLVGIKTPGVHSGPLDVKTDETPLQEDDRYQAKLPTAGVDKKGGKTGLAGEPLQAVEPKKSAPDLDMDSEADVIESIEPTEEELAEAFEYFLSDNDITLQDFSALTVEATESGSLEQMEELVTFQGVFEGRLDEILGLLRAMKAKRSAMKDKNKADVSAAWKKAREVMAADPAGVRAANKAGKAYVAPTTAKNKLVAMKNKKMGYGGAAYVPGKEKIGKGLGFKFKKAESTEQYDETLDEAVPSTVKVVRNNKRGLINSMDRKKAARKDASKIADPLARGKNQKPNTAGIADNANPHYRKTHGNIMNFLKAKSKLPEGLETSDEDFLESIINKYGE